VPRRTLLLVLAVAAAAVALRAVAFSGLDLYTDEAYYWLWSTRPAAGYFDHPPMVAWIIWASSRLVPGELGVRLLFLLLGGLTILFAALAAWELEPSPRAPVYAALLAASAPMLHLGGAMALPDGPVAAAFTGALWLLARARGRRWLAAGVLVGLALLSKYTAALLAPTLLLLVLWDRELRAELRTPWPWLGGAVAVLVFLPNLLWNARHGYIAILFQLRHGFRTGTTLAAFLEYAAAILGSGGLVSVPLGLWLAARARTAAERRLGAAALVTIAVTLYSAWRGSAEVNWPSHAYPALAALAGAWLARRGERAAAWATGVQAALGLLVIVGFAVELHTPRLLRGSVVVRRFHAGKELGRMAKEAAREGCAAIGLPEGCGPDPFVYPSSYQYAGHYAYYSGWLRLGPAEERPSQLDLWDERPRPGEPFLWAGQDRPPPERFRRAVRAEGEGPTVRFQVTYRGQWTRDGVVTPFARYVDGQMAR
jgi:hypothetical protein